MDKQTKLTVLVAAMLPNALERSTTHDFQSLIPEVVGRAQGVLAEIEATIQAAPGRGDEADKVQRRRDAGRVGRQHRQQPRPELVGG